MKLPFVSRLAYDLVTDERDRLRTKNDELQSAIVAIQRKAHGMPELSRQRNVQARNPDPIPDDIEELIAGFGSEAVQQGLREQALRLRASGHEWASIEDALLAESGGVEDAWEAETVGL